MTDLNFNEDKDSKILKVRKLPYKKTYTPGLIIQGKYLKNLGFNLFDKVLVSHDGNGGINISKCHDNER